jgi:hypothetical protein
MHEVVVFSDNPGVPFSAQKVFCRNAFERNLDFQFFNSLAGSLLHLSDATLCAAPPLGGEL